MQKRIDLKSFGVSFAIFVVIYVVCALIATLIWASPGSDVTPTLLTSGLISAVIFVVIYFGFATFFTRRQS